MLETQETSSKVTNSIIELAGRLADGEDVTQELHQRLTTQIAVVEKDMVFIPERAQSRGELFEEQAGPLFDQLMDRLEVYLQGLLELSSFFESEEPDYEALDNGVAVLLEVTDGLLKAQAIYGQFYAGFGDSRFPVVNVISRMTQEMESEPKVRPELEKVLSDLIGSFKDREQKVKDDEVGAEELRRGCNQAAKVLEGLKSDLDDSSTFEKHINSLGEALFEIESAAEERRLDMLEGPSVMPAANLFINTARRAIAGEIPIESIGPAMDAYNAHVNASWEGIEKELEKPMDSAAIQEELPNTMEIVDAHEEVMDRLQDIYDEEFDAEEFEEYLQELVTVVGEFKTSAQVFVEAGERVGKFVCPACGRSNPRANRVCEACGVSLPKLVSDEQIDSTFTVDEHGGLEDEDRMVMTENLHRLFKACEDIREDKITMEQFIKTLEWCQGLLDKMETQTDQVEVGIENLAHGREDDPTLEEEQNSLMEVMAYFREGIEEWEAGLTEMARYVEDPADRHLRLGIKRVWEGATAVNRCRVLGEKANEYLAKMEAAGPDGEITEGDFDPTLR